MTTGMTPPPRSNLSDQTDWTDSVVRRHLSRLAQVSRATASAIVITDVAGVTEWVNEGFTRITGYGFDEAVGRTPGQLLQGPDTDRTEAGRIHAALSSRQSVAAELVNYAKNGRRYVIGMKIEPLFATNGELDGFMAIEAEITGRYEQRRAMQQLTRRFDLATRSARVGVFERDANWEILWWSPVMWELFGQDPSVQPSNEWWLGLIHPEDRERIRKEVAHLKNNPAPVNLRYRIIRPDGELRHLEAIGAPDLQHDVIKHIAGITLDITERVQAAEREQALQDRLRESAHQAGMAEIATGVIHNVGNVLNSLGIANSTARRELKSLRLERLERAAALLLSNQETLAAFLTNDERGRHLPVYLPALAAQISGSCAAMQAELETTAQLLGHLSNIVSAQQQLARVGGQYESIRLNELLETALLVQASEFAQIEVVREYEELPLIVSDRHKLLQIVVNLISNARDAVHAGATDHGRVLMKLSRDGDHVRVTVEDSGVGMSDEVQSKLWRFGFTTKKQGHGFGLHNSANAAHEIGATLTAQSDGLGHGSRFILTLPIDNANHVHSGEAA
jgi:PAS domain S-box-containing protein